MEQMSEGWVTNPPHPLPRQSLRRHPPKTPDWADGAAASTRSELRQTSALNQSPGSAARRVKGRDQMPPRCVTSPPIARARSLVPLCCRWTMTDPKPRRRDPPLVPNPHFYTRAPRHVCKKKSINGVAWSAPWRRQTDTHTPNAITKRRLQDLRGTFAHVH